MKCTKCNYTTFDFHKFCPKCNFDLAGLKKKLHLIEFPLTDENNYLNFLDKDINSINEQPTVSIDKEPPAEHYTESPPKEDIEKTQDKKVDELLETSEVTDDSATIDQVVTENFKEALETFSEKDDDTIELDSLDLGDLLDTNKKE
jgi:hypothetical protein